MNNCKHSLKVRTLPGIQENVLAEVRENAYFTLEACIIMPIVFMVILFIMYSGFFLYNKCLIKQDTYRILLRACQMKNVSNEEVAEEIREIDSKWYYDKYVLCRFGDKHIEVNHDNIVIEQEAALNVNLPLLQKWLGTDTWGLETGAEVKRVRPTQIIRSRRKLEKLTQKQKENE